MKRHLLAVCFVCFTFIECECQSLIENAKLGFNYLFEQNTNIKPVYDVGTSYPGIFLAYQLNRVEGSLNSVIRVYHNKGYKNDFNIESFLSLSVYTWKNLFVSGLINYEVSNFSSRSTKTKVGIGVGYNLELISSVYLRTNLSYLKFTSKDRFLIVSQISLFYMFNLNPHQK